MRWCRNCTTLTKRPEAMANHGISVAARYTVNGLSHGRLESINWTSIKITWGWFLHVSTHLVSKSSMKTPKNLALPHFDTQKSILQKHHRSLYFTNYFLSQTKTITPKLSKILCLFPGLPPEPSPATGKQCLFSKLIDNRCLCKEIIQTFLLLSQEQISQILKCAYRNTWSNKTGAVYQTFQCIINNSR